MRMTPKRVLVLLLSLAILLSLCACGQKPEQTPVKENAGSTSESQALRLFCNMSCSLARPRLRHDLFSIVTLRYPVYLAAAESVADPFFILLSNLVVSGISPLFSCSIIRFKQGFFLKAED